MPIRVLLQEFNNEDIAEAFALESIHPWGEAAQDLRVEAIRKTITEGFENLICLIVNALRKKSDQKAKPHEVDLQDFHLFDRFDYTHESRVEAIHRAKVEKRETRAHQIGFEAMSQEEICAQMNKWAGL